MARPTWAGQMEISLVSIGVRLFPATNPAHEVAFHQIDRKSHRQIHHQNVIDHSRVENTEIVKGYEYSKGKYVVLEPKEIDGLRIPTRRTLEIKQFVDADEIALELYERPYFLVPAEKGGTAAYAVIHKALKEAKKAGLGEIAFSGREHLVAIVAAPGGHSRGLMAYVLRYAAELRSASEYFSKIPAAAVDGKQLEMANRLIRQYSAPFKISAYKDDYELAVRKLIEAKRKGQPLPLEEAKPRAAKVINLTEALKQSIKEASRKRSGAKPPVNRETVRGKKGPRLVRPTRRKTKAA
jgi:DNA end-binding protein Ku